jgi:hypothetical protein
MGLHSGQKVQNCMQIHCYSWFYTTTTPYISLELIFSRHWFDQNHEWLQLLKSYLKHAGTMVSFIHRVSPILRFIPCP